MKEVYLKNLEIQTWKTLTYTAVFFIGIVGLEIKGANDFVMICLYSLLMVVAVFGWSTASHHRVRQKEKFAFDVTGIHTPVLLEESLETLAIDPDGIYLDGTSHQADAILRIEFNSILKRFHGAVWLGLWVTLGASIQDQTEVRSS